MKSIDTIFLSGADIACLLTIDECINAVEQAFSLHALGKAPTPKTLGLHAGNGTFHIKAGSLDLKEEYFVAKINANFPGNPKSFGLPTIQGVVVVCDAVNGRLLALMDSVELTIIRTGAATDIAAKYLSLPNAKTATICGCGNQGRISLKALMQVRNLETVYAFDIDGSQTEKIINEFAGEFEMIPVLSNNLSSAISKSEIIITCTPSKKPFVHVSDVRPGTFIAAVGADNEEKQELFPELVAANKVIADLSEQIVKMGETHHAIQNGLMSIENIYAELGEVIAGKKPGRESADEIIIFDSTGTALQDVAAAAIVYEKAKAIDNTRSFNFQEHHVNVT